MQASVREREDVREKRRGHIHTYTRRGSRRGDSAAKRCWRAAAHSARYEREKEEREKERKDRERERKREGKENVKLYHESSMTCGEAAGSVRRTRGTTTGTTTTTTTTAGTHARHHRHRHRHSMTSYHRRQHGARRCTRERRATRTPRCETTRADDDDDYDRGRALAASREVVPVRRLTSKTLTPE